MGVSRKHPQHTRWIGTAGNYLRAKLVRATSTPVALAQKIVSTLSEASPQDQRLFLVLCSAASSRFTTRTSFSYAKQNFGGENTENETHIYPNDLHITVSSGKNPPSALLAKGKKRKLKTCSLGGGLSRRSQAPPMRTYITRSHPSVHT